MAAYLVTDVPVAVVIQREGKNVQGSYLQIVWDLFGKHTGDASELFGALFASGQGYWILSGRSRSWHWRHCPKSKSKVDSI